MASTECDSDDDDDDDDDNNSVPCSVDDIPLVQIRRHVVVRDSNRSDSKQFNVPQLIRRVWSVYRVSD